MPKRLPRTVVAKIDDCKILGIRAGAASDHGFVGVWPIVVSGRVFARSWSLSRDGWFQAFLDDPLGTIQAGERQVRVRAVRVRVRHNDDLGIIAVLQRKFRADAGADRRDNVPVLIVL